MKDFYDIDKVKAYAELEIAGPNLDLEQVTKLLGLNISYIRRSDENQGFIRAGVEISPAENNGDIGMWKYKTAEKGTYDTELQIEELVSVFRRKTEELKAIKEKYKDCTMKVNVVVYNNQRLQAANSVRAEQIRFLAEIGVGLYFDVYHRPKYIIRCHKKPKLLPRMKEKGPDNEQ